MNKSSSAKHTATELRYPLRKRLETSRAMPNKITRAEHGVRNAVLQLRAIVPEDAMTSELLGTEREGLAVRIRDDGLALTVGYLCLEAEQIWLRNGAGTTSPAHVIAQDTESGLALVRADLPLGDVVARTGTLDHVAASQSLQVVNSPTDVATACTVVAISEFAGRWEYLIDEALYTVPACDNWGGAALVDADGTLIGIGSLFLELPGPRGESVYGNLFVPVELIMPHVDDLCRHGARRTPALPWLGWMIQEHEGQLVVVGIYPDGPAQRAGIRVEDTVSAVNGRPVNQLADLFRTTWQTGAAGVDVPVTLAGDRAPREVLVASVDRNGFFQKLASGPVN